MLKNEKIDYFNYVYFMQKDDLISTFDDTFVKK